jgi:type IV secretory pathway VirB9-like protein
MRGKIATALAAFAVSFASGVATSDARATFIGLHFAERQEFTIRCVVGLECDVQLEPGERVNDGFNAQKGEWDPHMAYTGGGQMPLPHLILRPSENAHRTNIILTTTRRTYYLLLVPIKSSGPLYYSFQYDSTTYRNLANLALATQTALKYQNGAGVHPVPTATPADVADLHSVCIDYNYTYTIDRYLADDHPHNAKPSNDAFPGEWKPQTVCSDGKHTYVQLTPQAQLPVDLPIAFALTAEGDTIINSTFNANRWRYTVDGVYGDIVLELGSQFRPLRLRLHHPDPYGTIPEKRGKHQHDPQPVNAATPVAAMSTVAGQSAQSVVAPTPAPNVAPQTSQGDS